MLFSCASLRIWSSKCDRACSNIFRCNGFWASSSWCATRLKDISRLSFSCRKVRSRCERGSAFASEATAWLCCSSTDLLSHPRAIAHLIRSRMKRRGCGIRMIFPKWNHYGLLPRTASKTRQKTVYFGYGLGYDALHSCCGMFARGGLVNWARANGSRPIRRG